MNAAVLPVPVCAAASTSVPWRTRGIARSCTGVGSVYPSSVTVRNRTSDRPSSSKRKLVCVLCISVAWAATRWSYLMSGAAPTRLRGGGGYRRFARSIPDNGPMGAQGTRAIEAARRAGVPYSVHEYAHDERATLREGRPRLCARGRRGARPGAGSGVQDAGRLGRRPAGDRGRAGGRRGGPQGGRRCARRPEGNDGRPGRCRAGDGLRAGRDRPLGTRRPLPTVLDASAADWPTIHVSAGRRGLEIELAAADLVRLVNGAMAPIARRD